MQSNIINLRFVCLRFIPAGWNAACPVICIISFWGVWRNLIRKIQAQAGSNAGACVLICAGCDVRNVCAHVSLPQLWQGAGRAEQ